MNAKSVLTITLFFLLPLCYTRNRTPKIVSKYGAKMKLQLSDDNIWRKWFHENCAEWLDNVDEKRLSGAYFTGFPIYYKMIADRGLTLGEIRVKSKNRFSDFIHSIKQIEMKISDTSWVFFACNRYQSGYSNVDVESKRQISWCLAQGCGMWENRIESNEVPCTLE